MTDSAEQLEKARQMLAALVLAQWRDEIVIRQLDNPEPLTVRWKLTQLEVMDYAEQVFSGGKASSRRPNRAARLGVSTDRIDELTREFLWAPSPETGDPGGNPELARPRSPCSCSATCLSIQSPASPCPCQSRYRTGILSRRISELG